MADLLIKNTDHWMDDLSAAEVDARIDADSDFENAYREHLVKGDVIEVGPDNRWADESHGNGQFIIVRAPFLSVEQARVYTESIPDQARRRYRMWFETISPEQLAQHQIAPYVYKLNSVEELQQFGQDKLAE